jgi:hypothetical protein
MKIRNSLIAVCVLASAACTATGPQLDGAQYWQRVSASEAVYQQGPKAQQMLDRDIGRCVVDLHELERLGNIKNAIPVDMKGRLLDPDEHKMAGIDSPEHEGSLLTEQTNYQDFDGCMLSKGWERTKSVPYKVSENAIHNYYLANVNYGFDPRQVEPSATPNSGDFKKLNN